MYKINKIIRIPNNNTNKLEVFVLIEIIKNWVL